MRSSHGRIRLLGVTPEATWPHAGRARLSCRGTGGLPVYKAYCVVMSMLLVLVSSSFVAIETGCTASQLATSVSIIEQQLPVALNLASNLASISDPALGPVFTFISNAVAADEPVIAAAVTAWKANQGSGNLAALSAAVNALAGKISAQVL